MYNLGGSLSLRYERKRKIARDTVTRKPICMKDDELAASGKPDYTVTSGKTFVPIEIPYNY